MLTIRAYFGLFGFWKQRCSCRFAECTCANPFRKQRTAWAVNQDLSLPVSNRMTFRLLHSASSKKKVCESQWDWATAAALYRATLLQIWASLQWSMCASSLSPINPLDERCTTPIVWVHAQAIYYLYHSSEWILLIV